MSENGTEQGGAPAAGSFFRTATNWAGAIAIGILIGMWMRGGIQVPPPPAEIPAPTERLGGGIELPALLGGSAKDRGDGPFTYRFRPNDVQYYGLDAHIRGTGQELRDSPLGITLDIRFINTVETKSVDTRGNGTLEMRFHELRILGEFMGSPIDMRKTADGAYIGAESFANMPGLHFFDAPISIQVSPAGEVLEVSGPEGFDKLLLPATSAAMPGFPVSEINPGKQWESNFALPLPGVSRVIPTKTLNTLQHYADVNGRKCGVIAQQIATQPLGGGSLGLSAFLGDMAALMPEFKVTGNNTLYFDVDNGCLVHADIGLLFNLKLAKEMGGMMNLVSVFGSLLREVEGGAAAPPGLTPESPEQLLDMGVTITAQYRLL